MFVLSIGFKYGSVSRSLTPAPPSDHTTFPVAAPLALGPKAPLPSVAKP